MGSLLLVKYWALTENRSSLLLRDSTNPFHLKLFNEAASSNKDVLARLPKPKNDFVPGLFAKRVLNASACF